MNIGQYSLGQRISGITATLEELSELEYQALPRTFRNEKIFHAEQINYLGLIWDSVLASVDEELYKISLMIDSTECTATERNSLYTLLPDLINQFGEPSEHKTDTSYIWDTNWGNIVYTQTKSRFYALYFTSNSVAHNPSASETFKTVSFPFLAKLRRAFFWNLVDYTEAETKRWLFLRAIEWNAWPTFISQPIVPVLLIFFPWWQIFLGVLLIDLIWMFVRFRYINFFLVELGVFFVKLKWPAAVLSSVYLLVEGKYVIAILSLLWPLLAAVVGIPGNIGKVELLLAKKIGFVDKEVEI